jgi:SAM-dependent methyltransferase
MRNTDADWIHIGKFEPYYGVLTQEKYLMANITPEAISEFYEGGNTDINHILSQIRTVFPEFAPRTALDFGCGVGRLAFSISRHVDKVHGVDVSDDMLDTAQKNALDAGINHITFGKDVPTEEFDWVNSHIVFQHIYPQQGYALLAKLMDAVASQRGALSLQITFYKDYTYPGDKMSGASSYSFDGEKTVAFSDQADAVGTMYMYDYDLNRIFKMLFDRKFLMPIAQHTNHGGCHGVWIFARRY